ncbi:hypothetical protein [Amycolatopsis pigmentata]|uniref:Uncharacterized protein n=1 Tax=Amycolatopsis pigmentata TaxID=450801 RepID=A0ABW5FTA3_9PSEU
MSGEQRALEIRQDADKVIQACDSGTGTYHPNKILSTDPYEAVRRVYDAIAQPTPEVAAAQACGRFRDDVQQKFAADLGFNDCHEAVLALHAHVTNVNDYAQSIRSYESSPVGDWLPRTRDRTDPQ